MGRQASPGGEHPTRRSYPLDIVGAGLRPDEDYASRGLGNRYGFKRIEHYPARDGSWRSIEAPGDGLVTFGELNSVVKQRPDIVGCDAQKGLVLGEQAVFYHVNGNLDRGLAAAFAGAGLEHEELARLHRELHVLHVVEVVLQVPGEVLQLIVDLGHLVLQGIDTLRSPDTRHQVLALGHGQVLAEKAPGPGARVPAEDHTCAGHFIPVAHDHRLDDGRCADVRRNVVEASVFVGPRVVPGPEHGLQAINHLVPAGDVEDGVHHPRHRNRRGGPHRYHEPVIKVTAQGLPEPGQSFVYLAHRQRIAIAIFLECVD